MHMYRQAGRQAGRNQTCKHGQADKDTYTVSTHRYIRIYIYVDVYVYIHILANIDLKMDRDAKHRGIGTED